MSNQDSNIDRSSSSSPEFEINLNIPQPVRRIRFITRGTHLLHIIGLSTTHIVSNLYLDHFQFLLNNGYTLRQLLSMLQHMLSTEEQSQTNPHQS